MHRPGFYNKRISNKYLIRPHRTKNFLKRISTQCSVRLDNLSPVSIQELEIEIGTYKVKDLGTL